MRYAKDSLWYLVAIPLVAIGLMAVAQEPAEDTEDDKEVRLPPVLQDIPPEVFAKCVVETDLSLPTPAEIFDALAKQTNVRWRSLYRDPLTHSLADRSKAAVWIGTRITDGYLAMEARDAQHVRNLSKDILAYSRVLGLAEKTEPRIIRLDTFAEAQSWAGARFELEALQSEMSLNLREMRDKDLAEMMLVGVWLRALEIASTVVDSKDFDEMVICAGGIRLVDQLLDRLEDLSENLQKDESIEMAKRQLGRVSRIWKSEKVLGGRVYTNEEVKETHDRVTNVLQMFLSQR